MIQLPSSRALMYVSYPLLFISTIFLGEMLRTFVGLNFHTIAPHRAYRSAQPDGAQLQMLMTHLDVKTVVNLRGDDGSERYWEEARLVGRLGVNYRCDVNISASEMPTREHFLKLVDALETSAEPMLIHCWSGADRTGFVSVLYLLLRTETSLKSAKDQLSLRFGHVAYGRAKRLGRVLAAYELWLREYHLPHAPAHLRRWIENAYEPSDFNYDLPQRQTAEK